MRDVHCHILPGVDDGSSNMEESLAMVRNAMMAGVRSIVCTPHCRDPWFDYDAMWNAYEAFSAEVAKMTYRPELFMGFEVNYKKFMELGTEWIDHLACETGDFLLEMPTRVLPDDWERIVFQIQGKGYRVIMAHPERFRYVQENLEVVRRWKGAGCAIQVSSDFLVEGKRSPLRKTAMAMLEEGLVDHIGSDAHEPTMYANLKKLRDAYSKEIPSLK